MRKSKIRLLFSQSSLSSQYGLQYTDHGTRYKLKRPRLSETGETVSSLVYFGLFKNETGRHRVTHHEVSSFIHDV